MEGDHPAARAELYRAIDVFRALEDCVDGKYAINIAGCYNYIAETYRLQGDYETAFSHYDQAINYNRNREYYPGAAVFYTNYGVAAWQAGQREEARRMFHYAADIYASSHEYSAYPIALAYLACYDVEDGNDRRAAERLRHAMALNNRVGSCRWTGVTICLLWRIRKLLQARRRRCEELEALWPESVRALRMGAVPSPKAPALSGARRDGGGPARRGRRVTFCMTAIEKEDLLSQVPFFVLRFRRGQVSSVRGGENAPPRR